ncbi:N-acetylmuramoyl-L-alanine amidase family protein [Paenibacillus periandrae]|uniref:N-acetylmuramoyl-L-alanine amidase family protein n=1 Tax=Paenibacillus periandrae TaxID=1761741 RepID=UPI001F09E3B0|nr:N-acetylmuramoyl-L-alanine amidase [Paenibacillus periandrae]
MSKLQTSVVTALLAFGAVSLVFAYTQTPIVSSSDSALQSAAQTVPLVVSSSAESAPVSNESPMAPQTSQAQPAQAYAQEASAAEAAPASVSRGLIYLDPGHQRKGNAQQEPVSPDSKETKAKVTGGTRGVATGKPEYVLNLEVSLLLKEALIARGFEVQMTREDHDVDISNAERAEMANAVNAQLAVRIHADGNDSPKAKGYSVLYPDAGVRATRSIQPASRMAAESILEALKAGTDAASRGMVARSDLSGFNWSKVPVVLIELGFMTNPAEDKQLSVPEYQQQLADAIADGIDTYMKNKEN